jgi:hypothetical protein
MNLIYILTSTFSAFLIVTLIAYFKLREKYMVIWIGLAIFVLLFGVFFKQVNQIVQILGIKVYSNFIFLFFGICIGMLTFQLSVNLSRQEDKIQTLAEEISILKLRNPDENL